MLGEIGHAPRERRSRTGRGPSGGFSTTGRIIARSKTTLQPYVAVMRKLGTAITDMQKNVDALQKNVEFLSTVKSALGG